MGMGPYLPFLTWVWFRMRWVEMRYRFAGLVSTRVELDDRATTMHCWVPKDHGAPGKRKKPALLFIQGFGLNGTVGWVDQATAFAKKFDVYVPDLLFFGKSFTTDTQRSEIFQGECIKKMLDALKVDQVDIVGTSYGGIVAYSMANNYPKLVNRVVVASSGVMMNPRTNDRLLKLTNVSNIKELLVPKDVKKMKLGMTYGTVWRTWLFPNFVLQDMFDWFNTTNMTQRAELIDGMITGSKGAPPVPVVSQDVLILWGTKDQIFAPELAEELKRHVGAKAELIYMQNCGHVPQIERPREYNTHILQFLSA